MELFYRRYGESGTPLFILHGLLGSGRNWHSIAKALAGRAQVVVPDMRNHGRSPHSPEHTFAAMVEDIVALKQRLFPGRHVVVLGHSMGGLVTMEMAFQAAEHLAGVIIVDIAPRPHLGGVHAVLDAMMKIDPQQFADKKAIDAALAADIPSALVRQFVLTNISSDAHGMRWRVNLPVLREFLTVSRAYQPAPGDSYAGPALFIRGERSDYIRDQDFETIRGFFPQAELVTAPAAGHWVHYENPEILLRSVRDFLAKTAKHDPGNS